MTEQCPHCGATLHDYWWERSLSQSKWTEQQKAASVARQQSQLAYEKMLRDASTVSDSP